MRILFCLLLCCLSAFAQPYKANSLNTNVLGTNLVWTPAPPSLAVNLAIRGPLPSLSFWNSSGSVDKKRFEITDALDQLRFGWFSDNGGSSLLLGRFSSDGNFAPVSLSLSGQTNILSISTTNTLLLDGQPVVTSSTTTTNTIINATTINVESNVFNIAKGGHLTITNYIQLPWTELSYSGSNVTVNLTNSMFKLTLTNDAFFVTPTGLPGTNISQAIQIHLVEDNTGGRIVTLTNSSWVVSGSGTSTNAVPSITTNANAVTVLTFVTSPFSATKLYGVTSPF
jgi:hypothetical protein